MSPPNRVVTQVAKLGIPVFLRMCFGQLSMQCSPAFMAPHSLTWRFMVNTKSRLILKYGNRRLYDTTTHRYVTLEDMRQLVLHHVDFVVREKSSQADITFVTLLNVLLHSAAGRPELALNPQVVLDAIRMQAQPVEGRLNLEAAREHSTQQQVAY